MMSKLSTILLCFFFCCASVHAQVSEVCTQMRIGQLLPTDSVQVYLEYPELQLLSTSERKQLQLAGFEPQSQIKLDVDFGVSRGVTIATIRFIPVVQREGKWYKVVDYELKHRFITPQLSNVQRSLIGAIRQARQSTRYAAHSVLSTGKWVKIRVKDEGIYQFSNEALRGMGFADPSKVKVFGYGGRLLPDVLNFSGENALIDDLKEQPVYHRTDGIAFFCEGVVRYVSSIKFERNTFSNYSYYFLTEGDNPLIITDNAKEPQLSTATTVTKVHTHAIVDNDAFVWYGGGRDFYDSSDLRNGVTYTLKLPGCVDDNYKIAYDVSASNSTGSTTIEITKDGESAILARPVVTKYDSESESARGYRGSFTTSLSAPQVRLNVRSSNTARMNYFYVQYLQDLSVSATTQSFSTAATGAVLLKVAGADAHTRVWQVGNVATSGMQLPGRLEGTSYTAQANDGQQRFVLFSTNKVYPIPEIVGEVANQDLHADQSIDYVIIVPASGKLMAQAERLAQKHRDYNGLRVKVVRADQLYNEFSSGTPDIAAYRRYLKMLYDRASDDKANAPKYLLYFGNCSYDNRMITSEWKSQKADDYLLAGERNDQESYTNSGYSIGTMHSYVTDDHAGFLDDGEGDNFVKNLIDVGIGRYPCTTEAEAKQLVDATIAYLDNKEVGSWKNKMWLVADVGDNNLHMKDAQNVSKEVTKAANSDFLLRRIFSDAYTITQSAKGATYPEATEKLRMVMQQGALIFNYNGHGSPDRLSKQFLLTKEQMAANKSASMPLWIFASCEVTPYDQPISDLGRCAIFNEHSPAIGVICASRSVYANYNCALNRGYVKYLFGLNELGKRNTLGDALRLTKCELLASDKSTIGTDNTINKLKYILMGDPAVALAYPNPGIHIDSINGEPITSTSACQSLPVGGKVNISGYVNADESAHTADANFQGQLYATVFAPKRTITCKGYGNKSEDPLVYTDYTQTLFEGQVTVRQGRFQLHFMVPRGVQLSPEQALLSLYAVNEARNVELSGSSTQICFNGIDKSMADTLSPAVNLYIDTPDFPNGGVVSTASTLYASVADSSAISVVSGILGHDMELWFDNDPSTTVVVKDYFTYHDDSYQRGWLAYPLMPMSNGRHQVTYRVWDVFDNATTRTLQFVVDAAYNPDQFEVRAVLPTGDKRLSRFVTTLSQPAEADVQITTEVYSIEGMRVWHAAGKVVAGDRWVSFDWDAANYAGVPLPSGVYLYRSKANGCETKTHKFILP